MEAEKRLNKIERELEAVKLIVKEMERLNKKNLFLKVAIGLLLSINIINIW